MVSILPRVYWGGGYGGWGWGAFGLGLYLPLTFALAYGISANQGGGDTTTIVNNYPAQDNSQNYPAEYQDQDENYSDNYVPRVPSDAVYISPEMMNDPKVKKALAAMKAQQNPGEASDAQDSASSTSRALQKGRAAMAA